MSSSVSRAPRIVVVVVEDHEDTGEMLRETFERAGMDVRVCSTADEALGAVVERATDVVVTDLRLAEGPGGAYLASALRADPSTAGIAVLAISGACDPTPDVVRAVDAFLAKPVDLSSLPGLVTSLAETTLARRRRPPSRRPPSKRPSARPRR